MTGNQCHCRICLGVARLADLSGRTDKVEMDYDSSEETWICLSILYAFALLVTKIVTWINRHFVVYPIVVDLF